MLVTMNKRNASAFGQRVLAELRTGKIKLVVQFATRLLSYADFIEFVHKKPPVFVYTPTLTNSAKQYKRVTFLLPDNKKVTLFIF